MVTSRLTLSRQANLIWWHLILANLILEPSQVYCGDCCLRRWCRAHGHCAGLRSITLAFSIFARLITYQKDGSRGGYLWSVLTLVDCCPLWLFHGESDAFVVNLCYFKQNLLNFSVCQSIINDFYHSKMTVQSLRQCENFQIWSYYPTRTKEGFMIHRTLIGAWMSCHHINQLQKSHHCKAFELSIHMASIHFHLLS